MNCSKQKREGTSTIKQMNNVSLLKMAICSGKITGKQIASNATNFSFQSTYQRGTPESAWRTWETPRNYRDDSCLQRKVLLTEHGAFDQGRGHVMRAMYLRIVDWSELRPSTPEKPEWRHHCTRRRHAYRFHARITSVRWLRKYIDTFGGVFVISVCLPYI